MRNGNFHTPALSVTIICCYVFRESSILSEPTIYQFLNKQNMEETKKKKVFSTLADTVVFAGTQEQCESYRCKHENSDNSLYILLR